MGENGLDQLYDRMGWKRTPLFWRLEDCVPVPLESVEEYLAWTIFHDREEPFARVRDHRWFNARISTIFIPIDMRMMPTPKGAPYRPVVFETHVFGGPLDHMQWRYKTWQGAERGHRMVCRRVMLASLDPRSWRRAIPEESDS